MLWVPGHWPQQARAGQAAQLLVSHPSMCYQKPPQQTQPVPQMTSACGSCTGGHCSNNSNSRAINCRHLPEAHSTAHPAACHHRKRSFPPKWCSSRNRMALCLALDSRE